MLVTLETTHILRVAIASSTYTTLTFLPRLNLYTSLMFVGNNIRIPNELSVKLNSSMETICNAILKSKYYKL